LRCGSRGDLAPGKLRHERGNRKLVQHDIVAAHTPAAARRGKWPSRRQKASGK
jgi:hypothetical protein